MTSNINDVIHRNNLENGSFGHRENLHILETADSVSLSLFMGINGKSNRPYEYDIKNINLRFIE